MTAPLSIELITGDARVLVAMASVQMLRAQRELRDHGQRLSPNVRQELEELVAQSDRIRRAAQAALEARHA